MFRRVWQSVMIFMARSDAITRFMQKSRATSFLVSKYVAGNTPEQGVEKAQALLTKERLRSSLFYLGEYVDSAELAQLNIDNKLAVAGVLENGELDLHISVDPSQVGFAVDPAKAREAVFGIAKRIKEAAGDREGVHCLMLDMEDDSYVDLTISLHNELKEQGYPLALTMQAYLKRTADDMQKQIDAGGRVRLVKGAFVGSADIAYTTQSDIKDNYRRLVAMMLSPEAKQRGFYPIIATHDDKIHEFAIEIAKKNGWQQGEYEFEMLLGVRQDVADALAERGERVRLYVPFGQDWWPYAVRRIGENPRNGVLLFRSLFS
ncbi:MAG: proline dehydrogenase family protein [Chromatiales bacterium]|nr:proline dehydrogenase family protein [Chromatiales bacterium]